MHLILCILQKFQAYLQGRQLLLWCQLHQTTQTLKFDWHLFLVESIYQCVSTTYSPTYKTHPQTSLMILPSSFFPKIHISIMHYYF